MPKLDTRYEKFAQALARHASLRTAAKEAGFTSSDSNKSFLSKLSRRADVAARTEEIKRDRAIAFAESGPGQVLNSGTSMAELFTEEWITEQYLKIHAAAMEAGSFPAANVAMKNVEAQIRKRDEALENGEDQREKAEDQKIKTSDLIKFLGDMRAAMGATEVESGAPSESKAKLLRHRYD